MTPTHSGGETSTAEPPTQASIPRDELKTALAEVLHEHRGWLVDVLREALDADAAEQMRFATEARAVLDDPRVAFPPVRGRA